MPWQTATEKRYPTMHSFRRPDIPARGLRRSTRANLHSKVARPHQNTTLPLPVKHHCGHTQSARLTPHHALRLIGKDRKSVVSGKRVSVRVELGGRSIMKKKTTHKIKTCEDIQNTQKKKYT